MIRVLHIHTLPIISGSGMHAFLIMTKINRNRFEPEFACASGGELLRLVRGSGIEVREIRHFVRPISFFHDIMAVFELVHLIKKEGYAIVHTHNSKAGFIGRLAAKIAGVPVIIHTVHGFSFHPYERFWRRKLFIFLERLAAQCCNRMIAVSPFLIDWALKEKIAPRHKLIDIRGGIELEKFFASVNIAEKKKQLGITEDELVVAEVAKLWKGKGQEILLEAVPNVLREIPKLKVLLVGEGSQEQRLKSLARRLGIEDKIIFTGFRWDIPELTAVADIACLPSFWEGMGRSVLEAMVCAKPVVASRVGGIVDLVEDSVTGFLVSPGDTQALAQAIIRLLKDKELRVRMGEAGKRKIDDSFSAQKMVKEITNLYEELLKDKGLI